MFRKPLQLMERLLGRLPIVGEIFQDGTADPVYDVLMILGPVIVLLVIILDRNVITNVLAVLYVHSFFGYVGVKFARVQRDSPVHAEADLREFGRE